ncbi:acyl-CoA dehydrogenase [Xylanibacillus composti]|uniref:Acyl-CoA dehydrogenase n=1 Tax=Xylanibacillus composti TaxID=1572762 RepID=A0A8J4M2Q6_9BACL|nr:acyl-CoA dehydrogenase family protein [Xylanibacillus composti]MDT9726073.1 acyl-CoA dehydrogenase [Xylanibacillus composti]GIQ68781.1 acyl-CoA dehydrogenase [Xylanibacillus composti]
MKFQDLPALDDKLAMMDELARRFAERASAADEENRFVYENIEDLKQSGYTSLTVPAEYGGQDISLYEMVRLQEKIAEGDGSTSLSIGWHMGIMKNLAEKKMWEEGLFAHICGEVLNGALLNGASTERQTGSPTRGGKPQTTAKLEGGEWIISGRKTFTTMSPVLDYFIVSAAIADSDDKAGFLVPRKVAGLHIEETWDSIAMRGSGSHDLVLDKVRIPKHYLVERFDKGSRRANGWLLHIPACYMGIAQAAQSYAVSFAKSYSPNSIEGSIIDLPNVQQKIGEMELELMSVRTFLYEVARRWDESSDDERERLSPALGAVKLKVTNTAIHVVDLAMRVVGARSLSAANPLQRYYRDVRAGLHNPPMDDTTIQLLARHASDRHDG